MDERLRSRFQSGLIADIGAPELETRIAILQQCRQRENAPVPDEVLDYIGSAIQSNIRALEGALTRLIAYSSIMNVPATAELAQSVLKEYFIDKPIRQRKITIDEVVDAVGEQFGITPVAIKGPNRNKDVSLARQVAMYICRELLPELNTTLTGEAFGGRDHATIVYACQRVKMLCQVDTELKTLIAQLNKKLSG
jgi:chromosomal replication initiator protein